MVELTNGGFSITREAVGYTVLLRTLQHNALIWGDEMQTSLHISDDHLLQLWRHIGQMLGIPRDGEEALCPPAG